MILMSLLTIVQSTLPPPTLWDVRGLRIPFVLVGIAVEVLDRMTRCFVDGTVIASMFHQFCLRVGVQVKLDHSHFLLAILISLPFSTAIFAVLLLMALSLTLVYY